MSLSQDRSLRGAKDDFDRVEEVIDQEHFSVPASDVGGQTGQAFGQQGKWEGDKIYELDAILDRDEIGVLLWAEHLLTCGILSTQTADGTLSVNMEISTSPAGSDPALDALGSTGDIADTSGDFSVESEATTVNDEAETVGRVLTAIGYGPITDGTNGVGGSGSAGRDEWVGQPVAEPVYDVRDELFTNGYMEHSNVSDAALYAHLQIRHVYGIQEL